MKQEPSSQQSRAFLLGRSCIIVPMIVWTYNLQGVHTTIDVFGDSNWAACSMTRRSTLGAAVKIGAR